VVRLHARAATYANKIYLVGGFGGATDNLEYTPPPMAPYLVSISPSEIVVNTVVEITIKGSMLDVATGVFLDPGHHELAITLQTDDEIKAELNTSSLEAGTYELFVTSPSGNSNRLLLTVVMF